jgi:hypothetical protein
MTVVSVTTLPTQPGTSWEETLEGHRKAKAILERHGAKNVRLLVSLTGAQPVGTAHSVFEADDNAALGKVTDAIYTDPEMLALMNSGGASSWTTSVLVDIPLG